MIEILKYQRIWWQKLQFPKYLEQSETQRCALRSSRQLLVEAVVPKFFPPGGSLLPRLKRTIIFIFTRSFSPIIMAALFLSPRNGHHIEIDSVLPNYNYPIVSEAIHNPPSIVTIPVSYNLFCCPVWNKTFLSFQFDQLLNRSAICIQEVF